MLFARIVQAGGISRCANELGMERSTISRRLKGLERELGVKLLRRSPKQTSPTNAGRRCFDRCVHMLEVINSVDLLTGADRNSKKRQAISVGAAPDIIDYFLEKQLVKFENENPAVNIQRTLIANDTHSGAIPIDLLVTWSATASDTGLVRKLTDIKQSLYASPNFLKTHGPIDTPADLRRTQCIVAATDDGTDSWLLAGENRSRRIQIAGEQRVPTYLDARETAIAGFGVCMLPCYLGDPFVQYGRLAVVLPAYSLGDRPIFTVTGQHCAGKPRVTQLRLALERPTAPRKRSVQRRH